MSEAIIRTAGREEHPRKLLMPWRLAAASKFSPPKGAPTRRAAISVSAVWRWQKLDPSASNASVPSSGTDDRTRDSRARRSKANAESPTAQRTAETAHSAPAAPRMVAAEIRGAPRPAHGAAAVKGDQLEDRNTCEGFRRLNFDARRAGLKHRKSNPNEIAHCRRLAHRRSTRAPM